MTDPLQITFYDRLSPAATAGVYTIRAEQCLTRDDVDFTASDPLPVVEQQFEIRAVRFVLDDSSVHAHYPPSGSHGDYGSTLPHITLNRAILPWERELSGTLVVARAPWLALLVFAAGELPDDPDGKGLTRTRTVDALRHPEETDILGPDLSDEGITPGIAASTCQTIDVPAPLFTAVVPREAELSYLAHLREVRTAPQRTRNGEILTEGDYAVLAANRFPRPAGAYAVHLVSLEGFIGLLGPDQLPSHINTVRLCALRSWSFVSDPHGQLDAPGLLRRLAEPGRGDPENLALRLPHEAGSTDPGAAERHARERLRLGYTPVTYRVRSGEVTFGWYRGPFTPLVPQPVPEVRRGGPHTTADHALIYDPEHGVFDVSYAAAWTLGRALALADPTYTEEMTRVRREVAGMAARMMAMGGDPERAGLDPDAARGNAWRTVADEGFGRSLVDALRQPPVAGSTPMTVRRERLSRHSAHALMADPHRQRLLTAAATTRAPTLPGWLEGLALLHHVPFGYLVPHPAMLPPESLRLFHVDPTWIAALLAGAQDIGVHTSLDVLAHPAVRAGTAAARGASPPVSGVLIRSALVRAWPEFDLVATVRGRQVGELRRAQPAEDVLLCLFDAVPDEIVIREPGQGIHFGVDDGDVISLRDLTPGPNLGFPLGRHFPAEGAISDHYLRDARSGRAVLNLCDAGGLVSDLADVVAPDGLTPRAFALQLVNAPVEQRITTEVEEAKAP
ncbi:hypothetical protein [Streptoalloteichus hindustanus]|uniref:Uncharacterized protein n=1 Tax=Streptoalloteichus hindustanus TaxID=2017 RepID=A0A1M5M6R4_STRHI|nr:hypothetical protein [Streptoalloteichus hindustanus]SHG72984.1 hypothetical protein SAMN05444320_11312 [Streptoalloteichus hindustanus]